METESTDKPIDYKSLLQRYIYHVVDIEGVDFLDYYTGVDFSKAELTEMRRLYDEFEFNK